MCRLKLAPLYIYNRYYAFIDSCQAIGATLSANLEYYRFLQFRTPNTITLISLTMCDVATVQKIANCLGVNPGKVQLNEEQVRTADPEN